MKKVVVCGLLGLSTFLTSPVSSARAEFTLLGEALQLCAPWLEIQERLNQVTSLVDDVLSRQAACVDSAPSFL